MKVLVVIPQPQLRELAINTAAGRKIMAKTISVPARLANFGFGETQVFSKNGCLTSLTVEEYFGELQEPQAKQACDSIAEKMNVPKKTPL